MKTFEPVSVWKTAVRGTTIAFGWNSLRTLTLTSIPPRRRSLGFGTRNRARYDSVPCVGVALTSMTVARYVLLLWLEVVKLTGVPRFTNGKLSSGTFTFT